MTEALGVGGRLGHYRILGTLGAGGMGEVYRAEDLKLGREVAIKTLPRWAAGDRSAIDRLLREARLASALSHPGIVTVHAIEEADGAPFLVMELVEGETLRARLARGPLELPEIVSIGGQVGDALDAAHRLGLIHRDVKSTNILLTPDGRAKVADFGLAKRLPGADADPEATAAPSLTATGVVVGTAAYMSPEQSRGEGLDARTDVFSLGVVLYEAATGRLPFEGPTVLSMLHEIALVEPPAPSRVRAGLPRALDHVVLRAMAKSRERRFGSAADLAQALRGLLGTDLVEPRRGGAPDRVSTRVPSNLPASLTSFVGRRDEMEEIAGLLGRERLVTLTGAGGCGKSRLSLQIARNLLESFPDGAWLAEFASLSDPGLVPGRVAALLGIREMTGTPLLATLAEMLHDRSFLLILDNCEHVLGACAELAGALTQGCPGARILATSREPLGIHGERLVRVPPLSVPRIEEVPVGRREIGRNEAVRLFVERAAAIAPSFVLTEDNALALAQICARLDGIPLAIELAAARIKVLPVAQILVRLEDRFRLLTSGGAALPHQQTLRATVDWSYEMLPPKERTLFDRLSSFAGGASLEAVESVCAGGDDLALEEVLDLVSRLADKSLVVPETGAGETARYRLLETLREYGEECLERSGTREAILERHAEYFLGVAERAEPELCGRGVAEWLARLEEEHDNLRQAGSWFLATGRVEAMLRMGGALWRFWRIHGHFREGRKRLEAALTIGAQGDARSKALLGAGALARSQSEYDRSWELLREALPLAREAGNRDTAAGILLEMGIVADDQGRPEEARDLWEECLAIRREAGDQWGMAVALHNLGTVAQGLEDEGTARSLYHESLAISRDIGYPEGEAMTLNALGSLELDREGHATARRHHTEALAIHRRLGDRFGVAYSLRELGRAAIGLGDRVEARRLLSECVVIFQALGDRLGVVETLEHFAILAAEERKDEHAFLLLGVAETARAALGAPLSQPDRANVVRSLAGSRDRLGDTMVERALESGRSMALERAVDIATERH
jgi:predicted ATPase